MGWSLASQSSSNLNMGFQDFEMRLPKVFNKKFDVKMMKYR